MLNEYLDCFLGFWCQESHEDFKPLEVKQGAVASEIPSLMRTTFLANYKKLLYVSRPGLIVFSQQFYMKLHNNKNRH